MDFAPCEVSWLIRPKGDAGDGGAEFKIRAPGCAHIYFGENIYTREFVVGWVRRGFWFLWVRTHVGTFAFSGSL